MTIGGGVISAMAYQRHAIILPAVKRFTVAYPMFAVATHTAVSAVAASSSVPIIYVDLFAKDAENTGSRLYLRLTHTNGRTIK